MKFIVLAILAVSISAFAGKEERDYKASTAEPAIKSAVNSFKKACGCNLKIDVKWDSFKNKDDLMQIPNFSSQFTDNSEKYCDTADTKKAMCALKSIKVNHGATESFSFAKGTGSAVLGPNSVPSWEMITAAVDK